MKVLKKAAVVEHLAVKLQGLIHGKGEPVKMGHLVEQNENIKFQGFMVHT